MKNFKNAGYSEKLAAMSPGESVFVKDRVASDLAFLYGVARRAGIKISIRPVEFDEIYMAKGVRIWRV
ncbi:MAG: hypothetical protein ACTS5G_00300 [Burkholderiales bacterium]